LNCSNLDSQVNRDTQQGPIKLSAAEKQDLVNATLFSRSRHLDQVSTASHQPVIDAVNSKGAQGLCEYLQKNGTHNFDLVHSLVLEVQERERQWIAWQTQDLVLIFL
jgi:Mn-containing catalase